MKRPRLPKQLSLPLGYSASVPASRPQSRGRSKRQRLPPSQVDLAANLATLGLPGTVLASFSPDSSLNYFRQRQRLLLTSGISMFITEINGKRCLMSQHFLLSAKARSLSLAKVARMSDEEAHEAFQLVRWAETKGEPVCVRCGSLDSYSYKTRKVFRCKACSHQFTVTSGTIFASRKLPVRDYLLAIAIFVNGAKGHSALQLSRDLDCQYRTAFGLCPRHTRSRQPQFP